jgi:hypothetical protein
MTKKELDKQFFIPMRLLEKGRLRPCYVCGSLLSRELYFTHYGWIPIHKTCFFQKLATILKPAQWSPGISESLWMKKPS